MNHQNEPMTDTDCVNVLGTKLSSCSGPHDKVMAATKLGLIVGAVFATAVYFIFAKSNPISDLYLDSQKRQIAQMEDMKCVKTGEHPGDYLHTFIAFKCPNGTTRKVLFTRAGGSTN